MLIVTSPLFSTLPPPYPCFKDKLSRALHLENLDQHNSSSMVFFLNMCCENLWDLCVFIYSMGSSWELRILVLNSSLFPWLEALPYLGHNFFNYNIIELASQHLRDPGYKYRPWNSWIHSYLLHRVWFILFWDVKHPLTMKWKSELVGFTFVVLFVT